jgi:hypothetical protein
MDLFSLIVSAGTIPYSHYFVGGIFLFLVATCLLYALFRRRMGTLPIFSLLAISPIGAPLLAFTYCEGGFGSAVTCSVPGAAYLGFMMGISALSLFLFVGLLWLPVVAIIWIIAPLEALWKIIQLFAKGRDISTRLTYLATIVGVLIVCTAYIISTS